MHHMQAQVGNMPAATEAQGKIDKCQGQSSKTCSCSVSRLLDGTNAQQLSLMKAEFARHGGRLDLQEVRLGKRAGSSFSACYLKFGSYMKYVCIPGLR